jgi:hypothetical protein
VLLENQFGQEPPAKHPDAEREEQPPAPRLYTRVCTSPVNRKWQEWGGEKYDADDEFNPISKAAVG